MFSSLGYLAYCSHDQLPDLKNCGICLSLQVWVQLGLLGSKSSKSYANTMYT